MKQSIKKNIKIIICVSLILGLIIILNLGFISSKYINRLSENNLRLKQNNDLVQNISNITQNIFLLESTSRGYIISEDDGFLKDYKNISVELIVQIDDLKNNVSEEFNEFQYKKFKKLIINKIQFTHSVIEIKDSDGKQAAIKLIADGIGIRLMNDIQQFSNDIKAQSEIDQNKFEIEGQGFVAKIKIYFLYATITELFIIILTIIFLIRDINSRNRIELQLEKEKMNAIKSSLSKEQFLANMSHEIRTPMNAIVGFVNLLGKTELNTKQTDYLKSIKSSSESLLVIINDILDFSKIEAGMLHIEKINFSVQSLINSLQSMFMDKILENNLNLVVDIDNTIPNIMIGDPMRLTQILVNLINNAIKFTEKGEIKIECKLISNDQESYKVKFIVKDSGIGISENKLNTIFERFEQENMDTTRKYGGTGLGLAIVKKLVELQGGEINVISKKGSGSEFSFIITYDRVNNFITEVIPKFKMIKKTDNKVDVLLVEDNLMNQKLATEIIESFGFEVVSAGNGEIAVELLKHTHFDVVLMDIQMPVLDGYRAASKIREELRITTPIIAMTAHVMAGEREKCISYGMNDYITKPFKENDLYQLIIKYLPSKFAQSIEKDAKEAVQKRAKENKQVCDLSYLNEIAKEKKSFLIEMIEIFIDQNKLDLKILEEAIQENNFEMISSIAHKMKTSIRFVGLSKLIEENLDVMENIPEESHTMEFIKKNFKKVKKVCEKAQLELAEHKKTINS